MKKLNVYIIKQLFISFLLIALGMVGIIWLSQSLRMIDWIVNRGVSVKLFVELTLLVLPNFIAIIMPLAFFIVLMFIYQRLLADRELVVMKAVGLSLRQIAEPAIWMAVFLVAVGYFLTLWCVPESVHRFKELQFKIRTDLAQVAIQEGEFNTPISGLTVYVREFEPTGKVRGIIIHDSRTDGKRTVLVAEDGFYMTDSGQAKLVLNKGKRTEFDKNKEIFASLTFEQYTMLLEEHSGGVRSSFDEEEQPMKKLLTAQEGEDGLDARDVRKYRVEAVKRLTQPLYALVYLFVALLPLLLGYYSRRGQSERVYIAVTAVILIQCAALGFERLATKNLLFVLMMLLNIALPIAFGWWVLSRGYLIKDKKPRIRRKTISCIMAILLSSFVLTPFPALAMENAEFVVDTKVHKDAPADFEADEIIYNEKNQTVTAKGDVYVNQAGTILTADEMTYFQNTGKLQAMGNVVITRPDGVVVYSDTADVTDQMKNGVLSAVKMRLADGSTFKAEEVIRTDNGNIVDLKKAFFTPCTYCDPKSPLWSLAAGEVVHNYAQKEFVYKHALLKIKKVPVFYWPYLQYPDFQVKRKTGFLNPSLAKSSEMGFGVEIPFFWAISDNQNLLFEPTISVDHRPLLQAQYIGVFDRSKLTVDGSFTQTRGEHDNEAHIKMNYEYDISDSFRFRGNLFRVSNDTYFRKYPINNVDDTKPWLQSDATLEYFGKKTYGYARVLSFQNLRNYVEDEDMPIIPQVDYQYATNPFSGVLKGLTSVSHLNFGGSYYQGGSGTTRASLTQDFELPYISSFGAVFKAQGQLRYDAFHVKNNANDETDTGRFYPNAAIEARYPLVQNTQHFTQVLEPIAQLTWTPNVKQKENIIPNEDSLDFNFDSTNLFDVNRYTGYDRVETGVRANYGMRWNLMGPKNIALSGLFGQSYRISDYSNVPENAGLNDDFSSYVGNLNLDFSDFGFSYRFRLNQDTFKQEMTEFSVHGGRDPLRLGASYLYLKSDKENKTLNKYWDREEVTFYGSSKLSKNWKVGGSYRYNLADNGGPIDATAFLQYENECLILDFVMDKEFTKDEDYSGDTSFVLRLQLKTIGAI